MPLSAMDDFLAHQTPDTFDHVFTSDRNFYDRYYFNIHNSSDELFMVIGMGQYPNLGTTDAFASISHGDTLHVVRASRELGADRLDTTIGPFGVEVVEGLKKLRAWLEPNEWGVSFDLLWDGAVPSLLEPITFSRQFGRVNQHVSRFAQVGCWSGTLEVAGQRYEVTPDRWKGARDRSWGIRPVGEPEPPGIRAKAVQQPFGFFHNWMPMQFDDFMIKVFIQEDLDGRRILEESAKVHNFGTGKESELMGTPRHEFTYISGTRELEKAVIRFAHPSGEEISVTHYPQRTVYLAAGSGYRPEPDWAHGMYQGPLKVEGRTYDTSDPEVRRQIAGINETLCRFELSTGEIGWGMHENACSGIYRPYGFNTPDAVAP